MTLKFNIKYIERQSNANGSRRSRLPKFPDNRHMNMAFTLQLVPAVLIYVRGWIYPRVIVRRKELSH